jgi:hypothetical protein
MSISFDLARSFCLQSNSRLHHDQGSAPCKPVFRRPAGDGVACPRLLHSLMPQVEGDFQFTIFNRQYRQLKIGNGQLLVAGSDNRENFQTLDLSDLAWVRAIGYH